MNHNEEVLWVWLLESFGRLGSFTWGANQLDGTPYKPGHHADRVDVEWGAVLMGSKMDLEAYVRDLGWHDYNGTIGFTAAFEALFSVGGCPMGV